MSNFPNPSEFTKYYNTQPNQIPFRTKGMKETLWELRDDWTAYYKHNGLWIRTTIKKGFVCDLASIPWFAQPIIKKGKDGVHRNGTTLHDFHYMMKKETIKGIPYAYVPASSCTHENEAWVDGKWIPFDMHVSKSESDKYMFDVIHSTEKAFVKPRIEKIIMLAFKTWIAHNKWKAYYKFPRINPTQCG